MTELRVEPRLPPPEPSASVDVAAWVQRHQHGLWRFARLLGAAPAADDLVQDALLAALQKGIDRLPDSAATAWLRGAVRNLWRMQRRTLRRRPLHVDLADVEPVLAEQALAMHGGSDGSGDAFVEALRACVAGLDGRARRAIELRYRDEAPRASMAATLGMREHGIKTLLRRTRELLFGCVQRRLREERAPS